MHSESKQSKNTGDVLQWQPVTPQKITGTTANGSTVKSPPPLLPSPYIHSSSSLSKRWRGSSPDLATDRVAVSNSENTTYPGMRPRDSMDTSLRYTRMLEEDIVSLMGRLKSADASSKVSKSELIDVLDRSLLGLSHWALQTQLLQTQLLHVNRAEQESVDTGEGNPTSREFVPKTAVGRGESLDFLVYPYEDSHLTHSEEDFRRCTPTGDPSVGNGGISQALPYGNDSRRYSTSSGFSRGPNSTPTTSPPLYLPDEIHHAQSFPHIPAQELMTVLQTKGSRRIHDQQLEKGRNGNLDGD